MSSVQNKFHLHLLLQCLLLLRINQLTPLHNKSLPTAYRIHITFRHVIPIRKLTKILQLLFCGGNPERVLVERFKAREDQLRLRSARGPLADLFGESEGLRHGEKG